MIDPPTALFEMKKPVGNLHFSVCRQLARLSSTVAPCRGDPYLPRNCAMELAILVVDILVYVSGLAELSLRGIQRRGG